MFPTPGVLPSQSPRTGPVVADEIVWLPLLQAADAEAEPKAAKAIVEAPASSAARPPRSRPNASLANLVCAGYARFLVARMPLPSIGRRPPTAPVADPDASRTRQHRQSMTYFVPQRCDRRHICRRPNTTDSRPDGRDRRSCPRKSEDRFLALSAHPLGRSQGAGKGRERSHRLSFDLKRAGYAKARLRMSSMIATAVLRTSSVAG